MKKQILYSVLTLALFVGCKKNDGSIPKGVELERVPQPQVTKNAGSPVIDVLNLSAFSGKFDVGLYFPNDAKPSKLDVVVRKNGNNSTAKVFQTVTTYPTTLTISTAQLATLFGTAVVLGDNYDIGANVYTTTGNKYEAFPAVGNPYGTNVGVEPGASTTIRYSAVCAYNAALFPTGSYKIVRDDWGDYNAGDVTTVTQVDATHFSFFYKAAGPVAIIIKVDPLTNATSVTKQVYGTLGYPPGWPYGPISAESVANNDNVILPCDGIISVHLKHTVAAGSFGEATIQFMKM